MAPFKTNAKVGEEAPLQIPDSGRDGVLLDTKRRQSTMDLHLNQVLASMVNSRRLSGKIRRCGWSEKCGVRLQDA